MLSLWLLVLRRSSVGGTRRGSSNVATCGRGRRAYRESDSASVLQNARLAFSPYVLGDEGIIIVYQRGVLMIKGGTF